MSAQPDPRAQNSRGMSPKVSRSGGSGIRTQNADLMGPIWHLQGSFTFFHPQECRWIENFSKGRAELLGFGTLPFSEVFVVWLLLGLLS